MDLVVDACDGLWMVGSFGYGVGRLGRYDPATGSLFVWSGNVDTGYGTVPLRFGRAPGEEQLLMTIAGGWSSSDVAVHPWDVGVGQAPWP